MANSYTAVNFSGASGSGGFVSPADQNLDMGAFNILSEGGNGIWTVEPLGGGQDDSPAIRTAMHNAKLAGGGIVQLFAGTYSIQTDISPAGQDYMCGVTLRGMGNETILSIDDDLTDAVIKLQGGSVLQNIALDNITAGGTSVTTTTHSNAALAKKGDVLVIKGTDADGNQDEETFHEVAADGNGTTGVITLRNPILKTMTSCSIVFDFTEDTQIYTGMDNGIEDLKIKMNVAPAAAIKGIFIGSQRNFTLRNITFEGFDLNLASANLAPLHLNTNLNMQIENVNIYNSQNEGIFATQFYMSRITRCIISNSCIASSSNTGGIAIRAGYDSVIDHNQIITSGENGITISGSEMSRRLLFNNNYVSGCAVKGISNDFGFDIQYKENVIERVPNDAGLLVAGSNARVLVQGNQFRYCAYSFYGRGAFCQFANNKVENMISYGVILDNAAQDITVTGNEFTKGSGGDGCIVLQSVTDCKISDNNIASITGIGIDLQGTSLNNLVTGNKIRATSGNAIKLTNASDFNLVTDNMAKGLTITTGTGANNIFADNLV